MVENRYNEAVQMPAEPDWASLANQGKMFPEFLTEVKKAYEVEAAAAAKKPSEDELIAAQAEDIKRAHAVAKDEVELFTKIQNEIWQLTQRGRGHLVADEWMYSELESGRNVYVEDLMVLQPELQQAIDQEITDYNRGPDIEEATKKAASSIDHDRIAKIRQVLDAKKALDNYVKAKAI